MKGKSLLDGSRWLGPAWLHVWIGATVFAVACFFMIVGTYDNLAQRNKVEAILNAVGLVALLYTAIAWYLHFFLNPKTPHPSNLPR